MPAQRTSCVVQRRPLALCGCLRRAPGASLDVATTRIAWRHLALRVRAAVSVRHRDAPSVGFTSLRVNAPRCVAAPRAVVCIRAERRLLAFSNDILRCAAVYVVRWCVSAPALRGCIRMASRCSARCCPSSRLCGCRTFDIFAKFRQKCRMLDASRNRAASYGKRFGPFEDDVKRLTSSELFQNQYNIEHAPYLSEFAAQKTLESALNVPTNVRNAGIWQKCRLLEREKGEGARGMSAGDQVWAECWKLLGCKRGVDELLGHMRSA